MAEYPEKPDFPMDVPANVGKTVLHLVEGEHEVVWHSSRRELPWPPYGDGKCELVDGPECRNDDCEGTCWMHIIPGGWRQPSYRFCRCH